MDIRIVSPAEARREAAVACFQFEGDRAPAGPWRTVSPAIGESAARAAKEQGFDGKLRSFLLAVPGGAGRVLVTGLGRAKALGSEALRRAAADLPARCRSLGIRSLAVIPPFGAGIDAAVAVQAHVEGLGRSA
jgi:hypothetical protein